MRLLKASAKNAGVKNVRVQKSGCLDFCEFGTTCVVYPEGVWYSLPDEASVEDILTHLKTGKVAEHLRLQLNE